VTATDVTATDVTATGVATTPDAAHTGADVTSDTVAWRALPPAPPPAPRRQVLMGTALVALAGSTLMGGMLGIWMLMRERAVDAGERFPGDATIPEVPSNVMLITIIGLCLFAQWTVYAAGRDDRANVGLSLGLVGIMGIAFINAQAFIYVTMELPIAEGGYPGMFYAVTGTMLAIVVCGLVFTLVTAFRALGGRSERELVAAHALYWYFAAAAYCAVWFVVYVTK
jgi:heme/copper-type cytochrome/quinol oxidase subunit 3